MSCKKEDVIVQAIILAGGKGTRLKPYTNVLPKPLMPIGELPILEIVIRQLKYYGYSKIVLSVGHLSHLIQSFFGDGDRWGVEIEYSIEDKALGTAGPLSIVEDLNEDFLVMNGDILTDIDFSLFMEYHRKKAGAATLAYCKRDVTIPLGTVESDESDKLLKYTEKPTLSYNASMGIYCMNKVILDFLLKGQYKDLPNLMTDLIEKHLDVYTYPFQGIWLDIGKMEDYDLAISQYEQNPGSFLPGEA